MIFLQPAVVHQSDYPEGSQLCVTIQMQWQSDLKLQTYKIRENLMFQTLSILLFSNIQSLKLRTFLNLKLFQT